jgi:hypothetical protein
MRRVGIGNAGERLFRLLPVALEGHQHGELVPDVLEALAVIRQHFGENLPVGNVDHPAGALIGVDPVADLHQTELEDPDIDDVTPVIPDLDSIAYLEGPPPQNEPPSGEIHDEVLEGDRQTSRDQPQEGAD